VDAEGTELMRTTDETLTGGLIDSPDVEIMRDDLTQLIYERTDGNVEYLFDDTITALDEDADGVTVSFENRESRRFDLVIGADGMHSAVRALAFGPEADYVHELGTYLSIFSMPNFLELDHWEIFHRDETRMAGYFSTRGNAEARGMLGFQSGSLDFDRRDTDQQKQLIADQFADFGWETPRLLKEMWGAPDFYFDVMSQVRMPSWSAGRVTLVGDAGYCPSPLTGQGTSLALVGAYVLAAALTGVDHVAAFEAYEEKMREFVTLNQDLLGSHDGPIPAEEVQKAATAIRLPDMR
jgi:2-polyprenyl-6-methoxyphenol hydroxylase-like FAD-dependent oxidoreductase